MATGGAAAAAAAIANAIKASGVLITVEPDVFEMIASRQKEPLIVHAMGGFFGTKHVYLTSYKGVCVHREIDRNPRHPVWRGDHRIEVYRDTGVRSLT